MLKGFIVSAIIAAAQASVTVLNPPSCTGCTEIAFVWVSGAHYTPEDYVDIATEL
jgi:hypothetical protein